MAGDQQSTGVKRRMKGKTQQVSMKKHLKKLQAPAPDNSTRKLHQKSENGNAPDNSSSSVDQSVPPADNPGHRDMPNVSGKRWRKLTLSPAIAVSASIHWPAGSTQLRSRGGNFVVNFQPGAVLGTIRDMSGTDYVPTRGRQ